MTRPLLYHRPRRWIRTWGRMRLVTEAHNKYPEQSGARVFAEQPI